MGWYGGVTNLKIKSLDAEAHLVVTFFKVHLDGDLQERSGV